jgi:hypothetical protein
MEAVLRAIPRNPSVPDSITAANRRSLASRDTESRVGPRLRRLGGAADDSKLWFAVDGLE